MPGKLCVVVDTNLFHECLVLDQQNFPWSGIGDFDEIELIVTSPVQRELDGHKKDNRSRIKKRAILAVSWFREMLTSSQDHKVLREAHPRVTLRLDATSASTNHSDVLDYNIPDDRIVGTAIALAEADTDKGITLLSHDTGPAMKAKAVGLPFRFFPVSWLRPEEEDDEQKEIKKLRHELEAYQRSGPMLKVDAKGTIGEGAVVLRRIAFAVPTDQQVHDLGDKLQAFMERSDSSKPQKPSKRPDLPFGYYGLNNLEYVEPTEAEFNQFLSNTYPDWLDICTERLRSLADDLNRQIPSQILTVNLLNEGSRPAEQLQITFTARGRFMIGPPTEEDRPDPEVDPLPKPPSAPTGHWTRRGVQVASVSFAGTDRHIDFSSFPFAQRSPTPRNDHDFYYDHAPEGPVGEFGLTCRSFRHGMDPEPFEIALYPQDSGPMMKGSILVRVYASNASPIYEKVIPVKVVTNEVDVTPQAERMIASLQVPSDDEDRHSNPLFDRT
jgi:hypothetical protein